LFFYKSVFFKVYKFLLLDLVTVILVFSLHSFTGYYKYHMKYFSNKNLKMCVEIVLQLGILVCLFTVA